MNHFEAHILLVGKTVNPVEIRLSSFNCTSHDKNRTTDMSLAADSLPKTRTITQPGQLLPTASDKVRHISSTDSLRLIKIKSPDN